MSGLDPLTSHSINNDESGRNDGCFSNIVSFFKCSKEDSVNNRNMEGGYVEFGEMRVESESQAQKVGTFAGVFCPVVLSMFSALVFIRMGFIIGNAGLLVTLMQFGISYLILIFTVCSVCAISTNGAIEGGGVYFMISRSLGPEFGGAIGTLFFFANIVSSALCFSACTEGIIENFGPSGYLVGGLPDGHWWRTLYGSLLALTALGINLLGARYFAKASLAIWTAVTLSLASVLVSFLIPGEKDVAIPESNTIATLNMTGNYTGLSSATLTANLWPNYGKDYSSAGDKVDFATVFGVLFSGVTGVMAGANMSGELKNPGRSIPRGTLAALVFTGLTYLALSLFTAASCDRFLLQNNYIYMLPINVWPPFVAIGVLTATFSAGLSNMIGASRVLEALVKDNIFGGVLSWCKKAAICVLVSWLGAQLALLGGSLTAIARANCALFLLSYLAVNLACLALELAGAPNFRPTFIWFSWHSALCGLLGALAMMFIAASALAALALILCLCLVIALHLASPAAAAAPWGSISQALIFHQVRKYLLLLDARKEHVKYWRPQILLLVGSVRSAPCLARFSNQLKKGGLLVLGHVQRAQPAPPLRPWLTLVDHLKIKAFVELCTAGSFREGARQLAHLSGLGAMKPNTVMLGFHDDAPPIDLFSQADSPFHSPTLQAAFPLQEKTLAGPAEYVALLSDVLAMDKGLCICRHFQRLDMALVEKGTGVKYIDVWLTDFISPSVGDPFSVAGLFLLQLACILGTQSSWKRLKLRVMLTDTPPRQVSTGSSASVGTFVAAEENSTSCSEVERETAIARLARSVRPTQVRLSELLKLLRIQATLVQVEEWSDRVEEMRWSVRNGSPETSRCDLPPAYIKGVNDMIKVNSGDTAVIFMLLPPPPELNSSNSDSTGFPNANATSANRTDPFGQIEATNEQFTVPSKTLRDPFGLLNEESNGNDDFARSQRSDSSNNDRQRYFDGDLEDLKSIESRLTRECPDRVKYLNLLKSFTEDLPPTVLVHGLKTVTSTLL